MNRNFAQEMNQLNENNDLEELQKQASHLKTKKECLEEDVNKFAMKTLTFFIDLHNQISADLTEMEDIRTKVVEKCMEQALAKQAASLNSVMGSYENKDE